MAEGYGVRVKEGGSRLRSGGGGGERGIEDKNEVGEVRVWAKGCGVRNEKCRVRRRGSIESKG